jgi:4-amino-4-deoxy-L-arabinose transferase-like glycosyltransferase
MSRFAVDEAGYGRFRRGNRDASRPVSARILHRANLRMPPSRIMIELRLQAIKKFIADAWQRYHVDRLAEIGLCALAVGWCVLRFVGLNKVPYGLSTDETLSGLHVICLAQTGQSADGKPWPLFATGIAEGLYSPGYLYLLLGWTRLFGTSEAAIRGMSGAVSILAIAGIGLLARRFAGARAARLAMVAAALSPWSLQLAKLAVDGPMAPMFLVWGVYFFLRSPRLPWAVAGGVAMAMAAYSYSPVRVQVALVTLLLLVVERKRLTPARLAGFLGSMMVVGFPLARGLLDGTLMARAKALSIFTDDYVQAHKGELGRTAFLAKQILENLFEHLRPSYLFFTGDANIRHSTQIMGELGWLDILALVCLGLTVGAIVYRAFRPAAGPGEPPSRNWLLAGAAVLGAAFGTLPAALCWEGLPHALRSMGAWPAVGLFTGASLSAVWSRSKLVPVVALALALGQTAHFVPYYFKVYPKTSFSGWDGELRAAAESHDRARFAAVAAPYPELGYRYYLIRDFGYTCASSRGALEKMASGK